MPASGRTAVSRKIGTGQVVVVGAPEYLARAPALSTPFDLVQHSCLRNSAIPARVDWRFEQGRRIFSVPVRSRFESADYDLLHEATLAGVGLMVTLRMTVEEDLLAGACAKSSPNTRQHPSGSTSSSPNAPAPRAPAAP